MADNNKDLVSEQVINVCFATDYGLYDNPPFKHIEDMYHIQKPVSFLIINTKYFYSGNTRITPPSDPFQIKYIMPNYGKLLYEINESRVPEATAKEYLATYSLDGPFGKVADVAYLCSPDIEKLKNYLLNKNPQIQKQGRLMLKRDRLIIHLLAATLDAQKHIKNEKYIKEIVRNTFNIVQDMRDLPLENVIEFPEKLAKTEQILRESQYDEEKYYQILTKMQDKIDSDIMDGLTDLYNQKQTKQETNEQENFIDLSIRR